MTKTNFKRNLIAIVIAITTIIGSVAPAAETAQAAVYQSSIIYDGEGSISKKLTTGQSANINIEDSIITITVDGKKYGYYTTRCVATAVIANDDLLHMFWHTGHYYVYDLRESGMFIKAYKDSSQNYCSEETAGATEVKGTSTPNVDLHSSIIDGKYFYQYGKTGKKALMTRAEFTNIVDPQPTEPEKPTEPDKPTQPTEPEKPAEPDKPTQPTEPEKPAEPDKPTIDVDIDSGTHIEFDIEFWWKQYKEGVITWEQLTEVIWKYNWEVKSEVTEKETTYYFYDEEGKLIRTERILISSGTETGSGSGSSSEKNEGKADYEEKVEGNGGATGTVDSTTHTDIKINVNQPIQTTTTTTTATKKYPDRTKNTKPDKKGWITIKFLQGGVSAKQYVSKIKFNKKKGTMKFNGLTFKNIKDCGYIKGTTNVWFLEKVIKKVNGKKKTVYCKLWTLPRHAKKRTLKRQIKGKYVSVQKSTWEMGYKATKTNGNIVDLVAKDKSFDKKKK